MKRWLLSVGVAVLAMPGVALASDCSEAAPCVVTLHAGKNAKTWKTPERFGRLERVTFDADVGNRDLPWLQEGCSGYFAGGGVTLYVSGTCKRTAPFKLTYLSYRHPTDITLRYWVG